MQAGRASQRLLQPLAKLQVIADPALAIVQPEQAPCLLRAQVRHQRQRATAAQALAPALGLQLPAPVRLAVVLQGVDALRIHAQQDGAQGRAQAAIVGAMQQGQQQRVQLTCLAGGEQALPPGAHGGDAQRHQRLADHRRLPVRAHQHGDVTRLHRLALDRGGAGARLDEHAVDVRHAGLGGQLS